MNRLFTRFLIWFTAPDSPFPLAWFRMALSLFCIIQLASMRRSFVDVYGQYGFVQWAITRAGLNEPLPHIGNVALLLKPLGIGADASLFIVAGAYVVALLCLFAGWHTRLAAIAAWCLNFLFMHAGSGMLYGMDIFTRIGLFYLMIMPCGDALSLDARAGRRLPVPSVAAGITRRMLQLHLAIVYFSSGLEKAAGVQWWNGEAIWRSLMMPVFHMHDVSWMARVPLVPMAAGWFTLVTEIGYGFFIWNRRTRPVWLAATIAMHLGIGLFLGMWLFAWIMILLNLAAFGWEVGVPSSFRDPVRARIPSA